MTKKIAIRLAIILLLSVSGTIALISGEAWGFGLVSSDTRYINVRENPIEYFLVLCFDFGVSLWLLRNLKKDN